MFRKLPALAAFTALLALAIGLGCTGPGQPVDEPEDVPPIDVPAEDLKALVEGNNRFAIDLYKQVAAKTDGNIILSPYSISSALAMTYAGARGQTADEMKKVLHFTLPDERLHPAFGAIAHKLKPGKEESSQSDAYQGPAHTPLRAKAQPFQLNIANALWGQQGLSFRSEFLRLTKRNYAGGFRELDFATDPEAARHTINRWVEEKTQDKIKELLKRGYINSAVQLVLTNAIYFKASWATPFLKGETKDAPFEVSPDEKVTVSMMQTQERAHFRYLATDDCEWLELPYGDDRYASRVSMIVILPQKGRLAAVEKRMTPSSIQETVGKMGMHSGKVSLPKFQVRTPAQLKEDLSRMGMSIAFSGDADFSGMTGSRGLSIGSVIHQAYVNVDEAGTEAAAATAVAMYTSLPPPFSFSADRPFLLLIRDNQTGSILFSGRVVRPAKVP